VPQAMIKSFGAEAEEHIRKADNKYYVNLKALNALSLQRQGITQIDLSCACTVCESHRYWSHRVTRGQRGSQGAIIVCKEGNR
jgi:copper oxidase (laccase) domain-containing protein